MSFLNLVGYPSEEFSRKLPLGPFHSRLLLIGTSDYYSDVSTVRADHYIYMGRARSFYVFHNYCHELLLMGEGEGEERFMLMR